MIPVKSEVTKKIKSLPVAAPPADLHVGGLVPSTIQINSPVATAAHPTGDTSQMNKGALMRHIFGHNGHSQQQKVHYSVLQWISLYCVYNSTICLVCITHMVV